MFYNLTLHKSNLSRKSFSSVQSLSCVRLFATPWTAACQASLFITNSWSLPKLMSIELVIPSSHLILCCPLLLLPSIFPNIRVFLNEPALRMRWSKYWSFSPSDEHPELISLRMDWLDILALQGTINFMVAIIICSDFGAPKSKKSATVSPSICHEVMGADHYHSLALVFTRVLSFLKWDLIIIITQAKNCVQ